MYVAPPSETELQMVCGARRHIALKIIASSPKSLPEDVLGMSSPFAAFGLSVRLFYDHIRKAALRHDMPYMTVLPYAMAHEVGHVLLRSGSHSRWGIMSSLWTKYEYDRMAHGALGFSDDETKTMSANLLAPVCDKPDHRSAWADQ